MVNESAMKTSPRKGQNGRQEDKLRADGVGGGAMLLGSEAMEGGEILRDHEWVMERVKMKKREESRRKRTKFGGKGSAIWAPAMAEVCLVCVLTCMSVCQRACWFVCLPVCVSCVSAFLSVCVCLCLFACVFASVFRSVYLSVCLLVCVCPSVCLLSACFVCLSACLYVSAVCLCACASSSGV